MQQYKRPKITSDVTCVRCACLQHKVHARRHLRSVFHSLLHGSIPIAAKPNSALSRTHTIAHRATLNSGHLRAAGCNKLRLITRPPLNTKSKHNCGQIHPAHGWAYGHAPQGTLSYGVSHKGLRCACSHALAELGACPCRAWASGDNQTTPGKAASESCTCCQVAPLALPTAQQ